ncbi:SGNH/GDSL hydrolase family protein, partial [candidate division KSB1 bacterium]|nr:SGNH/GDSL hydrolase family protein [candidate division KSB1 bacterium]
MPIKPYVNDNSDYKHFQSFYHRFAVTLTLGVLLFTCIFYACGGSEPKDNSNRGKEWVGTWNTAPQLVEPRNNPPEPGLSNNTLRQLVRVSIGGDSLRVRFNNEFSTSPVTMKAVHIAVSAGNSEINPDTDQGLKFNGEPGVTIEPGTAVTSDAFRFALKPRTNVTITIFFGDTSPDVTGHPGSRTTSFILPGNKVS